MPAATSAERAQMDSATSEVRRVYALANAKVGGSSFLGGLFGGDADAQAAARANLRDLGERIDRWASLYRPWADRGQRDDGSEYSAARYLELGQDFASAAATHAQASWDASLFAVVANTATQTAEDVAEDVGKAVDVVKAVATSAVTPYVLGAVALVLALYIAHPYLKAAGVTT